MIRLSLLVFLCLATSCNVWHRRPTIWKDVRPFWEERITKQVHEEYFEASDQVRVNSFVIPVGEFPEVRLIVVGPVQESQLEEFVQSTERIVRHVMRYAADNFYTDRIRIQLTTYQGGQRRVLEYWKREWQELPDITSDIQLIREAQQLQRNLARQSNLE